MFDFDKWQEVVHALRSNKTRTIMTAIGVFWGILMLILLFGAGNGLQNGIYNGMGDFATNSVFMWTQRTSVPYKGFPRGRSFYFNNEDTKAIHDNIPEIKLLAPRIQARGEDGANNIVRGLKTGAFSILGDYPEFNLIDPMDINRGRFINYKDIDETRKVCVIGDRVVQLLFEEKEEPIGEYIRIQGVYFQVVGTFKSKHNGGWAEWQEQAVFLPFTTLQKTYNYGDRVGYYSMISKDGVSATVLEEKVKAFLKERHSIAPEDEMAIGSENVEKQFKRIGLLFVIIRSITWFVGIGSLIAGVIGISNIMLIIVRERTKEIGIQRAMGATPFKVINQILTESVFLTTIAGITGLLLGLGIVELISSLIPPSDDTMFLNPEISFQFALISLAILIFAGALAGLIPARKAVSIKPIEAIRTEN